MINIYNIFARMNFCRSAVLFFLLFTTLHAGAQSPPTYSSSDILHRIRKLNVLGSALYIAAHPDDENTRLIAWLANDQLLKTGYLSITRGDGGQNLIGDEQGIELGLIRTQELLAARRIDGGEQFFTRAFDFGYSKSTDEAMRLWGKEQVLGDVVWVIRKFQPDVIITRFPADNRAGHGQHSASSVLATEAFRLAADEKAYPDQFRYGVKPWQARRILWNSYVFGSINTTSEDHMKIEVGAYNALTGKGYGELAAESRSQHKSQGFGVPATRGSQLEYFSALDGSKPEKSLTEDIDLSWGRVGAPHVTVMINRIVSEYSALKPALSVPALVELYKAIGTLPEGYWKRAKMAETEEIIAAASGLWMEAYVTKPFGVQGDTIRVNTVLNNRNGTPVLFNGYQIAGNNTAVGKDAPSNENISNSTLVHVPTDKPVSQPYWLEKKMTVGSFTIGDQEKIGQPVSRAPYSVIFDLTIAGANIKYERDVFYKHTDPVKGELYQPLTIVASPSDKRSRGALRHISYNHIPDIYYFNDDTAKIELSNVETAGSSIGYIEGAGDKVPAALSLMGYKVTVLKENDIKLATLSQFDAVITGVRALNVHSYLAEKNNILNEYVKNGGNLVVQYNTNSFVGPMNTAIGPYPFAISRERITDEQSPVRFVLPDHQVFNYPNKITQKDFENWVQERGIYFAEKPHPSFQTPLALKDPGEEEKNGSLIIAKYGKGTFVYTGLAFFRQLPAGVTGAYRLFANIIALNKKR
jgi:LmbE family N-acetylglucosaminyl deacetylase